MVHNTRIAAQGSFSTSPSIYVAYSTLVAGYDFNNLDPVNCPLNLGPQYYNITRAYPPNYLMTLPRDCNYHEDGRAWSVLRVQDLTDPPQNWKAQEGCWYDMFGSVPGNLADLSPNGTEMAASPVLSYPPDILTINPIWASA